MGIYIYIYVCVCVCVYYRVTPAGSILNGTISTGGPEKRKDMKIRKSRSGEKIKGFSSASLFPTRKQQAVTQGGTI